jgi:hypothetical protein
VTLITGQEILISIVAKVNLTRKYGKIQYVNPMQNGQPSGIDGQSEVVLRAKRADGEQIGEYSLRVDLYSELEPGADREGLVNSAIPVSADVRTIELSVSGQIADVARIGGSLPVIHGTRRLTDSVDDELRIELLLGGPMEETHTYAVQTSTDHGRTWQTIAVGLKEPIFSIDRAQFKTGGAVLVRVLVTNGLTTSLISTEAFRL